MFKKILLVILLIFVLGAGAGYFFFKNAPQNPSQIFVLEIYDQIKENYWENLSDAQILELFRLSLQADKIQTREDLAKTAAKISKDQAVTVSSTVLASLSPQGRSGLFTQKQEVALKNTVENINPEKDLYKDLGLSKGASQEAVEQAYEKMPEELKKDRAIIYAKDVLSKSEQKQRYDEKGVEPAVFTKLATPQILYLQFKKFTPTSLDEFQKALEAYKDNSRMQALILDLRGNVGGAIDATAYFLGFFLGKGQYGFDFYKKGEYLPFKTQTDKLPVISKFKQMVILVDNNTQSSAEMMAASLKKYHTGVVVGVPTKGWGTVERVFPLQTQIDPAEKYSMFLVHSITLRDDNLPIEGRGVEPDININDPNWQNILFSYFRNQELILAVKQSLLNLP
ncbi:hypothetical protein HYU96_00575 [Candidatus Daviesbacteria bacterium]|nr:hypothetical protein [Candidatus Daviesbacteria bacterium]